MVWRTLLLLLQVLKTHGGLVGHVVERMRGGDGYDTFKISDDDTIFQTISGMVYNYARDQ